MNIPLLGMELDDFPLLIGWRRDVSDNSGEIANFPLSNCAVTCYIEGRIFVSCANCVLPRWDETVGAQGIQASRYVKGTGKFCGDSQRGPPTTGAQPGRAGPRAGRALSTMFALFDFDEAYDDWNGLKKGRDECTDPFKGLCKQLTYAHHYAMLLPIPDDAELKPQALKPDGTPWGRGTDSHISIGHLFYGAVPDDDWFTKERTSCGGQRIQFTGEK